MCENNYCGIYCELPFDQGSKGLRHNDFAVLGQHCAKIIN